MEEMTNEFIYCMIGLFCGAFLGWSVRSLIRESAVTIEIKTKGDGSDDPKE